MGCVRITILSDDTGLLAAHKKLCAMVASVAVITVADWALEYPHPLPPRFHVRTRVMSTLVVVVV